MSITTRIKSFIARLAKRYGYRIERIVDYSKHLIDVFELLINHLDPGDPQFFVLQVGANDGRTGDPLFEFIQRYRWNGLLIEPQPSVFKRLRESYLDHPQLILENLAVARQNGTLPIYTVKGSNQLATFDRKTLEKRVRKQSEIVELSVKTATFETLVQKHEVSRVDLLMVDTEGFDFEVIQMALQSQIARLRLIYFEHLHLGNSDRAACTKLLVTHGYRLHRDGTDTIALLEATDSQVNEIVPDMEFTGC